MAIHNLRQDTPEWHDWRAGGIGSSEAAIIMEDSTWTSLEELVEAKAENRSLNIAENEAMARGKRLEPVARAAYMDHTGIRVRPVCVTHDRIPWLRASLDGLSEDGETIVEIKCMGYRGHKKALEGVYPHYYKAQMYHQLLATQTAKRVHFWAWTDDEKAFPVREDRFKLIELLPDLEYMTRLLKRETAFRLEVARRAQIDANLPPHTS